MIRIVYLIENNSDKTTRLFLNFIMQFKLRITITILNAVINHHAFLSCSAANVCA
jgi:hypothetical protein